MPVNDTTSNRGYQKPNIANTLADDVGRLRSALDSIDADMVGKASSTHIHGNITNAGAIGATANLPVITGTSGVLEAGAFGTTANTFCQGNDARLSDTRTPTDNTVSTAKLVNDAVTYAKIQNVSATDRLLGRSTAGAGDVEEITCTAAGRDLLDDADAAAQRTTLGLGTLATQSGTFSGTSSGTNTGDQTITLTGDITGTGTGSFTTAIAPGVIVNADVNASAAIAGTKISPDFGSQAVTTTGTITGASLIPTSSTAPANGIYLPAANTVGIATGGVERVRFDSSGIGLPGGITFLTTSPASISADSAGNIRISADSSGTSAGSAINFDVDSVEALEVNNSGYLRLNRAGFPAAGICTQQSDSVLNLGGGVNPLNAGLNITLSGPDRVSDTGYLMRWNTNTLYQWDKTNDIHTWYTGTGNERMRLNASGHLGIAATNPGPANGLIRIAQSITGAVDVVACSQVGTVQSDVTTSANGYQSFIGTAAAAFTLASLRHFRAGQGTFGASSAVTNQFGFFAGANLTGATNNYGFYGDISSGTGRWNFYATGTAPNYFAGDIRTNTVVTQRTAPTNSNTSVTATAASLLDGLRTGTPTANINLTLPTGTNMDAAFQDLQANQSFEWSVINLAAATHVITVVQNTDHTVVGNMDVAANSSGRFLTRKTAANTFITYRIA